jgi:hypothetical protein
MDMYSKVLLSLFLVNGLAVIAGALKVAIDARKSLDSVKARNVAVDMVIGEIRASGMVIAAMRD